MQPNQILTNPADKAFEDWSKLPLDKMLENWIGINQNLFNHDCGITVLGYTTYSGFFRFLSLIALGATIGSRASIANDQQRKLDHLYKLYLTEVSTVGQITAPKASGSGLTALNNLANKLTGPSNSNIPASEPNYIQILRVIGFYLPPESIVVWKCAPQALPENFKAVINILGIYQANDTATAQSLNMKPEKTFTVNDVNYMYHKPATFDKQLLNQGRLFFYGVNSAVASVLSPIGEHAVTFMNGAKGFFKLQAAEAAPTIINAVHTVSALTNNPDEVLRIDWKKR